MSVNGNLRPEERSRLQELKSKFDTLEAKQERNEKILHDLGERMKELNCLYTISDIVDKPGAEIDEIIQGIIDIIPPGWQYPEYTHARAEIGDEKYHTAEFRLTNTVQAASIYVFRKQAGIIEVYLERLSPEMTFLQEEQRLLNAIAERIGKVIEYNETEKMLEVNNKVEGKSHFISFFEQKYERPPTLEEYREHHEKKYLKHILDISKNKVAASKSADISRAYLYKLIERYELE